MLLGFFRSAAPFLSKGSIPAIHGKRRAKPDDDDASSDVESDREQSSLAQHRGQRGTILVTLRNTPPYTDWCGYFQTLVICNLIGYHRNMPRLAKSPPTPHQENPRYCVLRSFIFPRSEWRGYEHRMTKGYVSGTGTGGDRARTQGRSPEERCWEFYLPDRVT